MKVTVEKPKKGNSKYPYIGEFEEVIVLFTSPNTGVRIDNDGGRFGQFEESWSEYMHRPLSKGTKITIEV